MKIEERLKELGVQLKEVPKPLAAYVPGVQVGDLLFISGQLPVVDGELKYKGYVGEDLGVEEAFEGARLAAINCLNVVQSLIGDLDRVEQIVKVNGYVRSAPGFVDQPGVINGASAFLQEVFGEKGHHARAAIGCNELPLGSAVEVEMIVKVS